MGGGEGLVKEMVLQTGPQRKYCHLAPVCIVEESRVWLLRRVWILMGLVRSQPFDNLIRVRFPLVRMKLGAVELVDFSCPLSVHIELVVLVE